MKLLMPAVSLAWLLAQPQTSSIIVGRADRGATRGQSSPRLRRQASPARISKSWDEAITARTGIIHGTFSEMPKAGDAQLLA